MKNHTQHRKIISLYDLNGTPEHIIGVIKNACDGLLEPIIKIDTDWDGYLNELIIEYWVPLTEKEIEKKEIERKKLFQKKKFEKQQKIEREKAELLKLLKKYPDLTN